MKAQISQHTSTGLAEVIGANGNSASTFTNDQKSGQPKPTITTRRKLGGNFLQGMLSGDSKNTYPMRLLILFLLTLPTLVLVASTPAFSGTQNFSGTFYTSNQSMWATGTGNTLQYNWNPGFSVDTGTHTVGGIDCGWLGCYGAELTGRLYGSAGLAANFGVSSGTVAANLPTNFNLQYPTTVFSNSNFVINDSMSFGNGSLTTQSPYITTSGGIALQAGYSLWAKGCLVGCGTLGPYSGQWNKQVSLWNLNSQSLSKTYSWDSGNTSLTFNAPNINTTGTGAGVINSSGKMTVLQLNANLGHYASAVLGFPLSGNFGACSILCASYNILSSQGSLSANIGQNFQLDPQAFVDLNVRYFDFNNRLINSKSFLEPAGDKFNLSMPFGVDHMLVTPDYIMTAKLNNDTYVDFSAGLSINGGAAKACAASACAGFGPLFNYNQNFNLGQVNLYNQGFNLDGWNVLQGSQFRINAFDFTEPCSSTSCFNITDLSLEGTPTPEPSSLLLLGSGILGLAGFLRRRLFG